MSEPANLRLPPIPFGDDREAIIAAYNARINGGDPNSENLNKALASILAAYPDKEPIPEGCEHLDAAVVRRIRYLIRLASQPEVNEAQQRNMTAVIAAYKDGSLTIRRRVATYFYHGVRKGGMDPTSFKIMDWLPKWKEEEGVPDNACSKGELWEEVV